MAKKTLILHAGMGKTGTTAVQETFWKNRAALSRAGIAYPRIGAVAGAHHLITPRIPPFLQGRRGWHFVAPPDWAPAVAALAEPRVFMSSELISAAEPAQIAAFCAALAPHFDLHLCLYLRRQDDMIAAAWAQAVKAGSQTRPLAEVLDTRMGRLDYTTRIAPWEQALGRDRLILLPYERSQFHAGDLIRDVLFRVLGLADLPPGFAHDPAANPNARLSIPATEFKRLVNLLIPDHPRANRFNTPLAACAPDPKGAHLLGRADRARIIAAFADSNARIARDYLNRPDGDLFRDPLPADAPDTAVLPDATALAGVAATLGQTAPKLLREIADLAAAAHDTPAARAAATRLRAALDMAPAVPAEPAAPRKAPSARDIARGLRDGLERLRAPAPKAPTRGKAATPPRLIVHYGMHKTGSSSIQETLWNNRTRLGPVQYLDFGRVNGSFAMTDFFRRDGAQARDTADFDAALAGLNGKTGVISAEVLSVFTAPQLDRFLAALRRAGASAHFIGYVRDPVGYYGSQFQQVLKTRALSFDDPATWRFGGKGTAAYFRWIDTLAARVGAAHVEAHPFRREVFPDGDVVRHFLGRLADLTGLDTGPIAIARGNESLSALAVKALYAWRTTLAPNDDATPHPTTAGDFITRLRDIPGDRFRLAPAVEARLAGLHPGFAAWAKDRLIWPAGTDIAPLPPPRPAGTDPVITTEADLLTFTPEDLATLARWAGLPPPGPLPESDRAAQVARMMAVARDQRRPRQAAVTLGRRIAALPARLAQGLRRTSSKSTLASPAIHRGAPPGGQQMLVHFGIRKTGSSSIQETLFRADEGALGDTRYLSYGIANSSLMVRNLFVAPDSHSRMVHGVLRTRFDIGLRRIASSPRAIFSAETISDLDAAGAEKLMAALSARGAQLSFIGYLRDPVTYLRSAFQEQLKNAYGRGFPFGPGGVPRRNYHQIVDRLDALAGPDRVQVFPFDRALFPQGDVVRHFLDQAGIDPERLTIRRVNESLSMTAVKALFAYRRLRAPRDTDLGSDTTRDVFVTLLSRLDGPAFNLSPAIDTRIAQRNTHILDWSERRLGTRLELPQRKDDAGIRGEEDMLVFDPEDLGRLDALARGAGVPGLPAGLIPSTAPEAVADLLHRLRLRAAQAKALPSMPGKDVTQGRTTSSAMPKSPAVPRPQAAPAVTGMTTKALSPLLVHFGMHKTGSSSIQQTLLNNDGRLGGQRYLSFGRPNSSFIINRSFGETQASATGRKKAREAIASALIAPARSGRAILSAEDICHLRPDSLAEFHRFLVDRETDATFIGYIRDPVSFARSALQQVLKTNIPASTPFSGDIRISNYHRIVDRLDTLARRDRVLVFPFDRALFPQGDVVRHFLGQAGIDPDGLSIRRVNESLSMTAVKALFAYRHLRAPHDREIGSELTRDTFVAHLSRLDGPAFQFSPDIDARIAQRNTHILDWSERRLGTRLSVPQRNDDVGIRNAEDMLLFDEADLARLAALARDAGVTGMPAGLTTASAPEAVADLLHRLRLKAAGKADQAGVIRTIASPALQPWLRTSDHYTVRTDDVSDPTPENAESSKVPPAGSPATSFIKSGQQMLIHFGIRKTGSSSIQETLFQNESHLGEARYLSYGMANSSLMVRNLFVAPIDDPQILHQQRTQFESGLNQVGSSSRVIFSAETISDLNTPGLKQLIATLSATGAQLTYIGYLRDPVSYTRSVFQEIIKASLPEWTPFTTDPKALLWNYHLIVDRLDALAGPDRVKVFPFNRAIFPQGDVVRHFLVQAGIDPDGLIIHRVNESLSMTAVKALYAYRRLRVGNDADIGSDTTRDAFVALLSRLGGPTFLLAPELDARIAAANTHILDWSEARLGQRLALPSPAPEGGILTEADMLHFTPQDLDALATLARDEGLPFAAAPTPDSVADFVHALRLSVVTPPG